MMTIMGHFVYFSLKCDYAKFWPCLYRINPNKYPWFNKRPLLLFASADEAAF